MKTLIFLMASLLSYHVSSAQCTKNLLLKFDQVTEIRDTSRTSFKTEGSINFTKEKILIRISVNGTEQVIESTIDLVSECTWDKDIKNGKSSYQVWSSKDPNQTKDKASLTLAGENGKLMVTFRPPGAMLQFHITDLKIIE
jgi:hypothetical protein